MDLIRNHNVVTAGCYGGLAVAKLVAGSYLEAIAYVVVATVYGYGARAELRVRDRAGQ